jgi:hypothetical protein
MKRLITALVLALPLLSGCALFESRATRALRATPEYRAGYGDGCASTNPSANPSADTRVRDTEAYAGNAAYRRGWNEGYGSCRGMTQIQNNPYGGLPRP